MSDKKTVFVGLSGGVDSSVAAARLIEQGYKVVGVFIKVWHPEFMVCNWEQERLDAMRVAAHLNIPFLTCDAESAYRDEVARYFIDEYSAGRTPNPDVLCNQHVKFGAFLSFAMNRGADFIATGHYARKINSETGGQLHRGVDVDKDQTYFLWSLSDKQLSRALFPVGDTEKSLIRKEAEQLKLPVAQKKDSQGICFLGHVDIPEFLAHYVDLVPGQVLDKDGSVIGEHKGALIYTIGQRHGFSLKTQDSNRKPMFVIGKDLGNNTITVASERITLDNLHTIKLHQTVLRKTLSVGDTILTQIRYRQIPFTVQVMSVDENTLELKPQECIEQPAAGQSCVLYVDSLCIGGGLVL